MSTAPELPALPAYLYGDEVFGKEKVLPLADALAYGAACAAAEREAAASLAEAWCNYAVVPASIGPRIAAAIRARGKP